MKILLTDSITLKSEGDITLECFHEFGEVTEYDNISYEELLKEVEDTDIILCNKTPINSEVFEKAPRLKYIGVFATGYNNIALECAKQRGIPVCNAGSYSTNAVAQQVMAYILIHYTKVPQYDAFVKGGGWITGKVFSPLVYATDEVYGKTLGIVGYGSIGKAVEKAAKALGINVLVHTRTVRENDKKFVSFEELLEKSDIISVHCPLNEQSRDMFGNEAFSMCKKGAFFINTSRGGVVDEQALFNALECGRLSGAAVDVLKSEPMSKNCVLLKAKNIIITPHTCWAPFTTRKRLVDIACSNLSAFLNGKTKNNVAQ